MKQLDSAAKHENYKKITRSYSLPPDAYQFLIQLSAAELRDASNMVEVLVRREWNRLNPEKEAT